MRTVDALRLLAELSASQWGMMTTAQAATLGIKRLELSRLSGAGHLERLAHGVYRDVGAPSDEFEGLRTAWLAADPSRTAEQRLPALSGGVVVMGESAASLHGVGDLPADRHELSTPIRRQSRRPEVNYRHRQLEPGDVTIAYGLPVTTIERTIADLVETRTDLSLVADVLRDAAWARHLDTNRLAEMLGPLAARNGLRKGDGHTLLDHLSTLAGLDTTSLAEGRQQPGALQRSRVLPSSHRPRGQAGAPRSERINRSVSGRSDRLGAERPRSTDRRAGAFASGGNCSGRACRAGLPEPRVPEPPRVFR